MSAVLTQLLARTPVDADAPGGVVIRHRWTVADFHRMAQAGVLGEDSRVELIEGELVDMAPIGSAHAFALDRLTRALIRALGERYLVRVRNPIRLGNVSEPQPDLVVALEQDYAAAHPSAADVLLVVEVADTSLAYDRDVKIPVYARHGVPLCWLVDLAGTRLTVYSDPVGGEYRRTALVTAGESVAFADAVIALSSFLG